MSKRHLLKDFELPKDISKIEENTNEQTATITVETLSRGFAHTLGNSLRRTMLSSIQGFAVTAVRITVYNESGGQRFITSEYDTVAGIKEDTIDVLDAIKGIKFIVDDEDALQFTLEGRCSGAESFTLGIFETQGVKILNKDAVLFTATEPVDMLLELTVELGRGYLPSEEVESCTEEGTIPIDALFSPVINVLYNVENVRVGQRSDYERLMLEIKTDGTITPADALGQAAKLLKDIITPLINFDEELVDSVQVLDNKSTEFEKQFLISLDELELSQRSSNCFKAAGIRTLKDLVVMSERDIENLPNFGKKCMDEVKEKLKELELSLGMKF